MLIETHPSTAALVRICNMYVYAHAHNQVRLNQAFHRAARTVQK